jgi:hypothetical protein
MCHTAKTIFLCLALFVVHYEYPEYIHIIYVYIGFLGQGIHFRGSFLSRGGHDRYGGHYYGGH